jgi:hypothetical protein
MADELVIARYKRWYRKLLRFYSRPYRARFGVSMEQTFSDLCRERSEAGDGLFCFILWMFVETSAGIIREHVRFIIMQTSIIRVALVTAGILLIPFFGNIFVDGWNWRPFAFVFWGGLLFGTGLTYELIAKKGGTMAYRAAVGVACATGIILFWMNAAIGIIGELDEGANLMYFGVFAVGFIGAFIARLQPRGMSRALVATAVAQALVPLIALIFWRHDFVPGAVPVLGVWGLNTVFVGLWLVSALLFRQAAAPWSKIRGEEQVRGTS